MSITSLSPPSMKMADKDISPRYLPWLLRLVLTGRDWKNGWLYKQCVAQVLLWISSLYFYFYRKYTKWRCRKGDDKKRRRRRKKKLEGNNNNAVSMGRFLSMAVSRLLGRNVGVQRLEDERRRVGKRKATKRTANRHRWENREAAFNKLSAVFCVSAVSLYLFSVRHPSERDQEKEREERRERERERAPLSTLSDQHLSFSLSLLRCGYVESRCYYNTSSSQEDTFRLCWLVIRIRRHFPIFSVWTICRSLLDLFDL